MLQQNSAAPDPTLELLGYFPPEQDLPFGSFFLNLKNGMGALHEKGFRPNDDLEELKGSYPSYLYANDIPIAMWANTNGGCPSCPCLLQAGYPEYQAATIADQVNQIQLAHLRDRKNWFELYTPLLKLFRSGIYFVTCSAYFPTNGEPGGHFWGGYELPRVNEAATLVKNSPYPDVGPKYLIGTQSKNKFSQEKLDNAKTKYEFFPGITYHAEGGISLLLDGHHRALAAAEDRDVFFCITISPARLSFATPPASTCKGPAGTPTVIHGLFEKSMHVQNPELQKFISDWFQSTRRLEFHESGHILEWPTHSPAILECEASQVAFKDIKGSFSSANNYYMGLSETRITDDEIEKYFTENWGVPSELSESFRPTIHRLIGRLSECIDFRLKEVCLRVLKDPRGLVQIHDHQTPAYDALEALKLHCWDHDTQKQVREFYRSLDLNSLCKRALSDISSELEMEIGFNEIHELLDIDDFRSRPEELVKRLNDGGMQVCLHADVSSWRKEDLNGLTVGQIAGDAIPTDLSIVSFYPVNTGNGECAFARTQPRDWWDIGGNFAPGDKVILKDLGPAEFEMGNGQRLLVTKEILPASEFELSIPYAGEYLQLPKDAPLGESLLQHFKILSDPSLYFEDIGRSHPRAIELASRISLILQRPLRTAPELNRRALLRSKLSQAQVQKADAFDKQKLELLKESGEWIEGSVVAELLSSDLAVDIGVCARLSKYDVEKEAISTLFGKKLKVRVRDLIVERQYVRVTCLDKSKMKPRRSLV